jgi:polyhydroxyalkanoate synthesis regulator phasin
MSDQAQGPEEQAGEEPEPGRKSTRKKMGEGIKHGVGFLSAFKDALEETIQEARDRGDLSAERAKEAVKEALDKAQAAGERARDRLDFAHQADVDTIQRVVESIRERVSKLEESVFGTPAGSTEQGEGQGSNGGDDEDEEQEEGAQA